MKSIILLLVLILFCGCVYMQDNPKVNLKDLNEKYEKKVFEKATFAGGCFWCTKAAF